MSSEGGWLRRNRRRLLVGSAVAGGVIMVGKMVHKHFLQVQEKESQDLLEKARRQHHYDRTEQTCAKTLRSFFPSLRRSVSENLDSAPLAAELRTKPPPERKLQLWEQLKVIAFSRCAAVVIGGVYISIMVRMQLNILAGYLYKQQLTTLQNPTTSENNNDVSKQKISSKLQEKYLDVCTQFVSEGMKKLCCDISSRVESVTTSIDLKQKMSLTDIEALLTEIFIQLETSQNDENIFKNPGVYFIPTDDIFHAATNEMGGDEKEVLKQMYAETLDVLESQDTVSLAINLSRQGVSQLVDRVADYYATIGMNTEQPLVSKPGPSNKSSLHDSGFVSPANISLAVAKLIPILTGLVQIPEDEQDLWLLHLQENPSVKLLAANVYETFCQPDQEMEQTDSWMSYISQSISSYF